MERQSYPSDLTDEQWELISPYFPDENKAGSGRKRKWSYRELVNAVFYIEVAGCAWRLLPHDLPPWKTVYHYFRLWRLDGTWEKVHTMLREEVRKQEGRDAQPSAGSIDSQSVKTTARHSVWGFDAGKKVNGRKRHILVDTIGLLLMVVVHTADIQDRDGAKLVLKKAKQLFSRLELIWADGGYAGKLVDWVK